MADTVVSAFHIYLKICHIKFYIKPFKSLHYIQNKSKMLSIQFNIHPHTFLVFYYTLAYTVCPRQQQNLVLLKSFLFSPLGQRLLRYFEYNKQKLLFTFEELTVSLGKQLSAISRPYKLNWKKWRLIRPMYVGPSNS